MAAGNRKGWKIFRGALVSAVAACGLFLPSAMPAFAQSPVENAVVKPPPGTKLLLTAAERRSLIDMLARVIDANQAYVRPGAGRRRRGSNAGQRS